MPMYKKRKGMAPEKAGVQAFNKAVTARLYNHRKAQAIIDAIDTAKHLASVDGKPFGDGLAMQNNAIERRARMTGVGMYTGHGGYFADIGNKIGDTFGGGWGGDMAKAGRNIGGVADAIFGRMKGRGMYTGHGDYHKNSIIDSGGDNAPLFGGDVNSVCLTHREYLTDIYGPPAGNSFLVQSYAINPALAQSFPFLSQIACNYDEYEFVQLIYSYKSTTTDIGNSTTGQCGTVIQAVNYNAAQPVFQDKGIMMEYFGAVSCKVTENSQCGVECDPALNAGDAVKYTRANPVIPSQDLKTYDVGTYQLAVANSPSAYANLPIGELWVDYRVILRKPKLFTTRGLEIDRDMFFTSKSLSSATMSGSNWFGVSGNTGFLSAQQNNIGCRILPGYQFFYSGTTNPIQSATTTSGCSIIIPAAFNGNLRVTVMLGGTNLGGLIGNAQVPTFLGNISLIQDIYDEGGTLPSTSWNGSNIANTQAILIFDVYVKQASAINYQPGSGIYTGGDNIISIDYIPGIVTAAVPIVASISIEQYQPLGGLSGLTKTSDRVVFVNAGGNVTVPVP